MSFMSLSRGHWFEPQPTSTSAPSPWSPRIYTYNIKVFSLQHKGFTVRKSKIYQQKNYNLLLKHPEFAIKTPMIYNTQDMPLNRFTSSTTRIYHFNNHGSSPLFIFSTAIEPSRHQHLIFITHPISSGFYITNLDEPTIFYYFF